MNQRIPYPTRGGAYRVTEDGSLVLDIAPTPAPSTESPVVPEPPELQPQPDFLIDEE
mgnify:CR=1 FL=1